MLPLIKVVKLLVQCVLLSSQLSINAAASNVKDPRISQRHEYKIYNDASIQGETWQNERYGKLSVHCPSNYGIYKIKRQLIFVASFDFDWNRDRQFYFGCKEVSKSTNGCYWTDWFDSNNNIFSSLFVYKKSLWKGTCAGKNEFIAGVESTYKHVYTERDWRFKCCSSNDIESTSCTSTEYINDPKETFQYNVAADELIHGFESIRTDYYENRRWKIHKCRFIRRKLTKQCENGELISGMSSSFISNLHDRHWKYECKKVANHFEHCYWTDYLNDLDKPFHAQCREKHFINGIESAFSDGYRDRRFRIHCCSSGNIELKECIQTELINNYHDQIQYIVPDKHILHKLESTHSNFEEDRKWKAEHCKYEYKYHNTIKVPDNDDYTIWCEKFQKNKARNHFISVIGSYLVNDKIIESTNNSVTVDCNNDEMYFSRPCVFRRAIDVGKKFETDMTRVIAAEEREILYKMWRIHPSLRELCPGYDTRYYRTYLYELSKFDSNLFTYVKPLSSENAKELRNEVNEVCSYQPQDPFCILKLTLYFVNMYERLPPDQEKWREKENNFKEAILLNFVILKTNNPDKFSEYPPTPSDYTKLITQISEAMLSYMFNNDIFGLAEYALFLPAVDYYKCGGIACESDHLLCTFMKIVTQTRVFVKTKGSVKQSPSGLLKDKPKFIQTNTDFRHFLLQNNLDRILDLVTTQQASSTAIGAHVIDSIRIDLQNVTAELKNEFSKTVNSRFSELKSYFKSVHNFDKSIADSDINFITVNIDLLADTMKKLGPQVEKEVSKVVSDAFHLMDIEVGYKAFRLAVSITQQVATIIKLEIPDAGDVLDSIDELTNAMVGRERARKLVSALDNIRKKTKEVNDHLRDNELLLKNVKKIVDLIRKNDNKLEKLDTKIQEDFLKEYAKFVPTLGTSDIQEVGVYWANMVEEACLLINEEATSAPAGNYKINEGNDLCWKTEINIAKLTEVYIEIYDFQFEMMDALEFYMRAASGAAAAESINTHFTKLKAKNPKSSEVLDVLDATARFTLLIYKMHTFQTVILYCDFLEYKNGGIRPEVCQGFNTDVTLLASTVIPTCNSRFYQIYNNVPSKPSHQKDSAFIDLTKLYQGVPTAFKIPNSEWLVEKGWITEREKNFAIYVEQFQVFLPSRSKTIHPVSVIAKTTSGSFIHPDGPRYTISPAQPLESKYLVGPTLSCIQRTFGSPYRICKTTPEDDNKICPSTIISGDTSDRLYPSIYSQWTLTVTGFENYTIPNPSTDLPLAIGLKICTKDKELVAKRRRRSNHYKKSVFGCCEGGEYWDNKKSLCSTCPNGTTSALDGYYCNHE